MAATRDIISIVCVSRYLFVYDEANKPREYSVISDCINKING